MLAPSRTINENIFDSTALERPSIPLDNSEISPPESPENIKNSEC